MNHKKKGDTTGATPLSRAFQPGGPLAPTHDKVEYERQMSAVPEGLALLEELTRHADMCQFCSQRGIEIPSDIAVAVRDLHTLPIESQVAEMQRINQQLMEYLHNECADSGLRM